MQSMLKMHRARSDHPRIWRVRRQRPSIPDAQSRLYRRIHPPRLSPGIERKIIFPRHTRQWSAVRHAESGDHFPHPDCIVDEAAPKSIIVRGANFKTDSMAKIDGMIMAVTFQSPEELLAVVPAEICCIRELTRSR